MQVVQKAACSKLVYIMQKVLMSLVYTVHLAAIATLPVQLCGQMCIYVSADEAIEAGAKVGVCSTSNEKAVQKIVDVMLDPKVASQIRVFAGDIVAHKKPDPAIYHLAAQELGVEPSRSSFTDDPLL